MSEKQEKMPRAEGYAGLRRVGPDEDVIIMGGDSNVVEESRRQSLDVIFNKEARADQLPRMTEDEFKDLHSRDESIGLAAEELLKQRIRECGLNPEQEGLVRILVGEKEKKIGTGNDLGTVLKED